MAKFASFNSAAQVPLDIYEGDFMECEGGYVKIFRGSPCIIDGQGDAPRLVSVIQLSGGQRVIEVTDAPLAQASESKENTKQKTSAHKVRRVPKK